MRWTIALAALAAVGCASTGSENRGHAEELELITSTKIEVADAIKTALEKKPGRVIDTELRKKNGRPVWEVDIVTPEGKTAEVDVDGATGQVVDAE